MIDNVHLSQVGQPLSKTPLPYPDPANTRAADNSDATVQVRFAEILNQAKQTEEADAETVQKARELLLSGQLTSPENIRAAAQSIITFGI